ncbi:MAG: hypothetical protein U1E05_02205, partial [Patescibacteria group bacterium]|nr:hypothetical protein [Patescibacteria group bacterium]
IVYASPVAAVSLMGNVRLSAPSLRLRADDEAAPEEVPLADLKWNVYPPAGYRVVRSRGSVHTDQIERPRPAAVYVAGALYWLGGGLRPLRGGLVLGAAKDGQSLPSPYYMSDDVMYGPKGAESMTGPHALLEDTYLHNREMRDSVEAPAEEPTLEVNLDMSSMPVEQAPARAASEALPPMAPAPPPATIPAQTAAPEPSQPADLPLMPSVSPPAQPKARYDELLGVRSLQIDFQRTMADDVMAFRSLGVQPVLAVTLSNRARFTALAWAVAVFTAVVGLLLTCRKIRCRAAYVVGVMLVASIVPVLSDGVELAYLCNAAFFAASALVPYYLLVGLCRWLASAARGCCHGGAQPAGTVTAAIALLVALAPAGLAEAQSGRPPVPGADRYVVQIVEPDAPVAIPDDALVVPYDPDLATGIRDATKVLVPHQRYVELWNRAYPDQALETPKPPADYALAGAAYQTVLGGDEFLLVEGELTIDVFTDGYVEVPLGLRGGVLARAVLDEKPARLSLPRPMPQPMPQPTPQPAAQQAAVQQARQSQQLAQPQPPDGGLLVLHLSGKGRHTLKLSVRLRLRREGGWRVADGVLPA